MKKLRNSTSKYSWINIELPLTEQNEQKECELKNNDGNF